MNVSVGIAEPYDARDREHMQIDRQAMRIPRLRFFMSLHTLVNGIQRPVQCAAGLIFHMWRFIGAPRNRMRPLQKVEVLQSGAGDLLADSLIADKKMRRNCPLYCTHSAEP